MKPILFNTEMVRAILDGRKTVTRRVVKPQPPKGCNVAMDRYGWNWAWWKDGEHNRLISPCYPGDIIYVREAWQQNYDGSYSYRAKDMFEDEKGWRPSIHMPKEAARIFLRVTDVRVERLWDVNEEKARAEGARSTFWHQKPFYTARQHFIEIWNSTVNKKDRDMYGWEANPWVWVIEFERITEEEAT